MRTKLAERQRRAEETEKQTATVSQMIRVAVLALDVTREDKRQCEAALQAAERRTRERAIDTYGVDAWRYFEAPAMQALREALSTPLMAAKPLPSLAAMLEKAEGATSAEQAPAQPPGDASEAPGG